MAARTAREIAFDDQLVTGLSVWGYKNTDLVNRTTGKPETRDALQILRDAAYGADRYLDLRVSEVHKSTFVNRYGDARSIGQMLSNIDYGLNTGFAALNAQVAALVDALAGASSGEPIDQEALLSRIRAESAAGAEEGVKAAIESVTRTETTTVDMKEES